MPDRGGLWGPQPIWRRLAGVAVVLAAVVILIARADHHDHAARAARRTVSGPVVLAAIPNPPNPPTRKATTTTATTTVSPAAKQRARVAAQDPQDDKGTHAARRARQALKRHRALQHVPYRHGQVTIHLTGARRDGKAVLTVTAPTHKEAKAGYRRFLARYRDCGRSYIPRFVVRGARRRG